MNTLHHLVWVRFISHKLQPAAMITLVYSPLEGGEDPYITNTVSLQVCFRRRPPKLGGYLREETFMITILRVFATATHCSTLHRTKMRHSYTVMLLQHATATATHLQCVSTAHIYYTQLLHTHHSFDSIRIMASTTHTSYLSLCHLLHTHHCFDNIHMIPFNLSFTTHASYHIHIIAFNESFVSDELKVIEFGKIITAPSRQDKT